MISRPFKIGILASGRGSNLQAIIDSVERGDLDAEVAVILSNKENAQALERGKKHNIECVFVDPKTYPDKESFDCEMIRRLREKQVDLICLAGYMRILGAEFIATFQGKILNIHPSLLPAFPGLSPQQQALDSGAKTSGCTVHFVELAVDAGPIVLQSSVPVRDSDGVDELSQRILEQEHIIYPRAIKLFLENRLTISGRRVLIKDD